MIAAQPVTPGRPRRPDPPRRPDRRMVAWVGFGAAAGWVVVGTGWGALAGLVVGLAGWRWLPGGLSATDRRTQAQAAADLPYAVDLLAAALRAGATPDGAARLVGEALGGPLGPRLSRVDRALRLGAAAAEAWAYLGDVEGAARIVRAAERSRHSGAAFAGSLNRVADDLRAQRLVAAEAHARRAGVLIVLPLGLCFLPAFVLTGLVPVIVAVVGGVVTTQR